MKRKRSPLHLKTALMALAAEFGDVVVENGIVTVTCPDGSVWDFTEPMMVKMGKVPKLNKWKDTQLSVRAESKSAATYKAELKEKLAEAHRLEALVGELRSKLEEVTQTVQRLKVDNSKLRTSIGTHDVSFLTALMVEGQLELRVRYSNTGWRANVVLLSRPVGSHAYQSMMAYYFGPLAELTPAPTAITLVKAGGTTPNAAIGAAALGAWNFKLGTPKKEESVTDKKDLVSRLIEEDYYQVSSKYRIVARLPPGKTGVQALTEASGDKKWAECLGEHGARSQFLRVYAMYPVDSTYNKWGEELSMMLTEEEFNAFKKAGGKTA